VVEKRCGCFRLVNHFTPGYWIDKGVHFKMVQFGFSTNLKCPILWPGKKPFCVWDALSTATLLLLTDFCREYNLPVSASDLFDSGWFAQIRNNKIMVRVFSYGEKEVLLKKNLTK
jgi:hypothetical protein